jgi:putative component of membrane protein insertase Oxa1/YidC/SpoIIIJ protein YidD
MPAAIPVASVACWMITQYQRHLSPRKGFRCAYRVLYGRSSCSQFAKRAIQRLGILSGLRLLRRRFGRCHTARQVLDYETRRPKPRQDRFAGLLGCEQGCSPACDDADVVACLGEIAFRGCCEAASGCHW